MKTIKNLILVFTFLMGSVTAFAQYYDPYNGTGAGVDRTIDRQRSAPRTKNKEKLNQKIDIVEETVKQLDKKLKLDDFQKAAITVIYNDNKDEILGIADEDIPLKAKKQKAEDISQKIDKQIIKLLSEGQAEKYQEIIDDRKY
ncbi:hypothetical protein E0W68_00240 [Flavobacterium salilacus subsp. salilacus]|uniref:hypothetical protein n=1 Tax=Flavobacterium TaxID=237 RepID=UPI001075109A|nr:MULTISPECIES: hypothetical protein [Flavobacterium]KAF2519701.1 hypothetical protein E0W68_00240 [Flavobacterium salilacus subsp. salilacus]MBE1614410.1 hypothetical protein [Flavobacterium sp. SaA2.13]